MEADLSQYHHIDYRDRWRFDAKGHRRLTLRMILVRVRSLPADSAVVVALGGTGWRLEHYLAADQFHATTGERHPSYPELPDAIDPARDKRLKAALVRKRERERAIAAGEIT